MALAHYNDDYKEDEAMDDYFLSKWAYISEHFDWRKVHKVMEVLNWKWYFCKDKEVRVPTIDELKQRAEDLLYQVFTDSDISSVATGGFEAGMDDGELWLNFSIEGINTTDNDD